jgi:hypothetical protein
LDIHLQMWGSIVYLIRMLHIDTYSIENPFYTCFYPYYYTV